MTTTNDWIKLPEKPTDEQLTNGIWVLETTGWIGLRNFLTSQTTHWRLFVPSDIPAPPKEQTQRERDEEYFQHWDNSSDGHAWHTQSAQERQNAWHAALAWERAEIAKLMDGVPVEDSCSEGYSKLRARLRP